MADELVLKWGGAKRWKVETPEMRDAFDDYQNATDRAAECEALCRMIDLAATDGRKIYLDWYAVQVSAAEAKHYVDTYGANDSAEPWKIPQPVPFGPPAPPPVDPIETTALFA